jgi:uncharacterized membrane protein
MTDSHSRSIAKGVSWRFFATLDTILLSYLFTSSIGNSLKIGGTELFTKIFLFYLHERLWSKLHIGTRKVMKDGVEVWEELHWRSVVKGISWRIVGTTDTIIIATFFTGDFSKALSIGATELITKIALFWLHERVWMKIKWGKLDAPAVTPTEPTVVS